MNRKKTIKVLIIDDSALVRQTLTAVLEKDTEISVVGAAANPYVAVERLKEDVPDVIMLDVEMPRMDGVTFLKKLMRQHPIPVVMCSSLTLKGSSVALQSLEYGAVDIIIKPKVSTREFLEESAIRIQDIVRSAAMVKPEKLRKTMEKMKVRPKHTADVMIDGPGTHPIMHTTEKIVVVGASTGGCQALSLFASQLTVQCPGVVVVQHMPETFTASFAERLDQMCSITVKEAKDGDTVLPGHMLVAPGDYHMLLKRSGTRYFVEIKKGPLVSRHRPSVDVLFRSAARYAGRNSIGIIMTGMGDDGAKGLLEMRQAGATTVAQDEESCIVFGMPKEAIKMGSAECVLPLQSLAAHAMNWACGVENRHNIKDK